MSGLRLGLGVLEWSDFFDFEDVFFGDGGEGEVGGVCRGKGHGWMETHAKPVERFTPARKAERRTASKA